MVTQKSRQESLADEKQREKKKKEKEFKKRHKQWLEGLKEKGKGNRFRMEPFKGPDWKRYRNLSPEERWERRKEAEKYQAKTKAKGGIVKKSTGGMITTSGWGKARKT